MSTIQKQISMQEYAQSINAIDGEIIAGPNGDFISFTLKSGESSTLPIGGNSQGMESPLDLEVLIFEEGGAVATVNQYVGKGVVSFA